MTTVNNSSAMVKSAAAIARGPLVPGTSRVLTIGDSHVEGLKPSFTRAARTADVRSAALFTRGTRLDQWAPGGSRAAQLEAALRQHPTHVVVSLGTNDGIANASPERVAQHTRALVERIRAAGAEPVFTLPPRLSPQHEPGVARVRQVMADTLRALGVRAIDPGHLPLYDGVHPTAAGYAQWSARVWRDLQGQR